MIFNVSKLTMRKKYISVVMSTVLQLRDMNILSVDKQKVAPPEALLAQDILYDMIFIPINLKTKIFIDYRFSSRLPDVEPMSYMILKITFTRIRWSNDISENNILFIVHIIFTFITRRSSYFSSIFSFVYIIIYIKNWLVSNSGGIDTEGLLKVMSTSDCSILFKLDQYVTNILKSFFGL